VLPSSIASSESESYPPYFVWIVASSSFEVRDFEVGGFEMTGFEVSVFNFQLLTNPTIPLGFVVVMVSVDFDFFALVS